MSGITDRGMQIAGVCAPVIVNTNFDVHVVDENGHKVFFVTEEFRLRSDVIPHQSSASQNLTQRSGSSIAIHEAGLSLDWKREMDVKDYVIRSRVFVLGQCKKDTHMETNRNGDDEWFLWLLHPRRP